MDDFLSIDNYKLLTNFIIDKTKSKYNMDMDISLYDETISNLMIDLYENNNTNMTKNDANIVIINKINKMIEIDLTKLLFEIEDNIPISQIMNKYEKEYINKNKESVDEQKIKKKFKKIFERSNEYRMPIIESDLDNKKIYNQMDIDKKKFNDLNAILLSPPKQYSNDLLLPVPNNSILHTHYLLIDSRDRNYDLYPNTNNYTVNLNHILKSIYSVELLTAEIPKTEFLIDSHNNVLHFQETQEQVNTNTYYKAIIPPNNYNLYDLATTIRNIMNDVGNSTYTVSYIDNKTKITSDMIGGDNIFNLIFKLNSAQYDYNSQINIQMPYSIGKILGYESNNLTGDSIYISDNVALYQTEDVIYLNIPELQNNLVNSTNLKNTNKFTKIPLTVKWGNIAYYTNKKNSTMINIYQPPIHIDKLTIQFQTSNGDLYNFHGLDNSLTFLIKSINYTLDN